MGQLSDGNPLILTWSTFLGMNKMVITANDKLFVTNDATTILRELDVFHPAGRLVLMNSTRLQEEVRSECLTQKDALVEMDHFF